MSSYTEKFDKVTLDDVVVRVSDLPDAEVVIVVILLSATSAISSVQIMYYRDMKYSMILHASFCFFSLNFWSDLIPISAVKHVFLG